MERFWKKVDRSPGQGPDGDCWEWMAYRNTDGYGVFWFQGSMVHAHRLAWQLENGEIPDGKCILHRCDTPGCVNPDHLFLGTKADNNRDMVEKGRHLAGHREAGRKRRGRPSPKVQGEKHGRAKLTDDQVLAIRREHAAGGVTKQALANRHEVGRTTIRDIIYNRTWRHLPLVPE